MSDVAQRPNVETILEDANSGGYSVEVAIEIRALCHYIQRLETEHDRVRIVARELGADVADLESCPPDVTVEGDLTMVVGSNELRIECKHLRAERDEARKIAYQITCAPECTWFKPDALPWSPQSWEVWRQPGQRYAPPPIHTEESSDAGGLSLSSASPTLKVGRPRPLPLVFRKTKEGEAPDEGVVLTSYDASKWNPLITANPDGSVVLAPAFFEAVRAAKDEAEPVSLSTTPLTPID